MTQIRFNRARAFLSKSGKSGVRSFKATDMSYELKLVVINITGWYAEYFGSVQISSPENAPDDWKLIWRYSFTSPNVKHVYNYNEL